MLEKLQETVLEQKDEECFDEDAINEIFRTMHTIKGSSGVMMFDEITSVSHKLEDIFYVLRESHPENVQHLKLVEHVLEVAEKLCDKIAIIKQGKIVVVGGTEEVKGNSSLEDVFMELIDNE